MSVWHYYFAGYREYLLRAKEFRDFEHFLSCDESRRSGPLFVAPTPSERPSGRKT
jgi:hypothetical protein